LTGDVHLQVVETRDHRRETHRDPVGEGLLELCCFGFFYFSSPYPSFSFSTDLVDKR